MFPDQQYKLICMARSTVNFNVNLPCSSIYYAKQKSYCWYPATGAAQLQSTGGLGGCVEHCSVFLLLLLIIDQYRDELTPVPIQQCQSARTVHFRYPVISQ